MLIRSLILRTCVQVIIANSVHDMCIFSKPFIFIGEQIVVAHVHVRVQLYYTVTLSCLILAVACCYPYYLRGM
jgi:hypothetical protein